MAIIIPALPYTLTNGTTADANQVMADFSDIVSGVNTNAAHNGPNSDITSLTGLTTPLSTAQGGTNVGVVGAVNSLFTSDGANGYWNTGIKGVTDNSAAAAGYVGEYQTSYVASLGITNSVYTNITTLTLSAGDWDVWGQVSISTGVANTNFQAWVSAASNTTPALSSGGYAALVGPSSAVGTCLQTGVQRIAVAPGGAIIYLGTYGSPNNYSIAGTLMARRRR
jgi:hypothetical protein